MYLGERGGDDRSSLGDGDHEGGVRGVEGFAGVEDDGGAGENAAAEQFFLAAEHDGEGEHVARVGVALLAGDELRAVHALVDGLTGGVVACGGFLAHIQAGEGLLYLQGAFFAIGVQAIIVPESVGDLTVLLDLEVQGAGGGGVQGAALDVDVVPGGAGHHVQRIGDAPFIHHTLHFGGVGGFAAVVHLAAGGGDEGVEAFVLTVCMADEFGGHLVIRVHLDGEVVARLDQRHEHGELSIAGKTVLLPMCQIPLVQALAGMGAGDDLVAKVICINSGVKVADASAAASAVGGELGAAPDGLMDNGLEYLHK